MGMYALFLLTGLLLCCLQAHPLLPAAQTGIRPDFILILVVYFSALPAVDMCLGAAVVCLAGYGLGMLSGAPFGLYAFAYLAVFVVIRELKRILDLEALTVLIVLTGMCSLAKEVLIWLLLCGFSSTPCASFPLKQLVLPQLFFTVLVAPLVFLALHKAVASLAAGRDFFTRLPRRIFAKTPQP